ncbi:MAG: hypothetical protein WCX31_13790 [Salinivirgaceae bacterium]|jgi:hypothetical protein
MGTALSNMQKELLKLYSTNIPDEQLKEIKLLLSYYFADKASNEMDKLWDENNWNNDTMSQWANEHNRSKGRN